MLYFIGLVLIDHLLNQLLSLWQSTNLFKPQKISNTKMSIIEPWLTHKQRGWRTLEFSLLNQTDICDNLSLINKVIDLYNLDKKEKYLKFLVQSPLAIQAIDGNFLMENLSEVYWRARVIEGLLLKDR